MKNTEITHESLLAAGFTLKSNIYTFSYTTSIVLGNISGAFLFDGFKENPDIFFETIEDIQEYQFKIKEQVSAFKKKFSIFLSENNSHLIAGRFADMVINMEAIKSGDQFIQYPCKINVGNYINEDSL